MLGENGLWDTQKTALVEVTGPVGLEFTEGKSQTTRTDFTNHIQVALGREYRPGSSSDVAPLVQTR